MLKINFWLMVLLSLMCLYLDQQIISYSIVAVMFHETGHIISLVLTKKKITKCYFDLGTVNIETASGAISKIDEIIIASSGCVFNLLLIIISCIFKNRVLFSSNLAVMLFNLLPVYGLDGYDILNSFLNIKSLKIISIVFNTILLILGIVLIFNYNFSLFFAAVYLFIKQRRNGVI